MSEILLQEMPNQNREVEASVQTRANLAPLHEPQGTADMLLASIKSLFLIGEASKYD